MVNNMVASIVEFDTQTTTKAEVDAFVQGVMQTMEYEASPQEFGFVFKGVGADKRIWADFLQNNVLVIFFEVRNDLFSKREISDVLAEVALVWPQANVSAAKLRHYSMFSTHHPEA